MTWRTRLPWRSPEAKAAPQDDLATLCLSLVSLAAALSLGRLFSGTAWVPYVVAAALLGHAMAWGLRRVGAGLTVASLGSALLSLLVAAELVVPQATTYGVPTPFTFQVMGQALSDAQTSFRTAVPPVAPASGFLAAAVVGLCMCAFLADWAAFRMRTAFEACVPAVALFVFASALGAKSHLGVAVAGFAATAMLFLIVQRSNLESGQAAWFGWCDRALGSLLGTGAVLGAVAIVGALVVGPIVPGAGSKALLRYKTLGGSGSSTAQVGNPLVDIRARLLEFANVGVFTVKAQRPAYWRLTSLDRFDGTQWSANETYASGRGQLMPPGGLAGNRLVQEVTVSDLRSPWLPAAYRPAAVEGVAGVAYSASSASVKTARDTSNGLTYTLTSVVPPDSPQQLRQAPPSAPDRSQLGSEYERYTAVGGQVSLQVRQKAIELAAGRAGPFAKALAIQDYLRSGRFRYSLTVPANDSLSAIDRFLFRTQEGFCQQFAGSYAVLARLMGLPTRVAVGFQPGTEQAGTFAVKDSDAHAWPEVFFEGIGWTAFEPTPGRGNPQAEAHTGVPYVPAAPAGAAPGPATTTPTTVAPAADQTTPTSQPETPAPAPQAAPTSSRWSSVVGLLRRLAPLLLLLGGLGGLVGGAASFVAWERRNRRGRVGSSPERRVHLAWEESLSALELAGVRFRRGETVAELLHRLSEPAGGAALAGVERGTPGSDALVRLGKAVVQTAYAGRDVTEGQAGGAEADRSLVTAACRAGLSRRVRLLSAVDPRPGLDRLRASRTTRNRPTPTPG